MVTFGFWTQSMNSFALVVVSIPLAVALGFAVGTWGFKSDRAYRVIMPVLDLMQTVPAFAYLLPILLLFRVRNHCWSGRLGPVCLSTHGPQYDHRPAGRSGGGYRIRPDERCSPIAAFLKRASFHRATSDPAGCEPDHDGVSVNGDHRLDHRRYKRHRVGGATHHPQRLSSVKAC